MGVAPVIVAVIGDLSPIAAKAARMTCVAVPEREDRRFAIADGVLGSLFDFG